MSDDWRQFLATSTVIAAVALTTLPPRSHAAEADAVPDVLEKFTVGGKLNAAEYADIRRLAAKHCRTKNVTRIEVLAPGKVKVWTGPQNPKPLSGGGEIMLLQRRGVRWNVRILESRDF